MNHRRLLLIVIATILIPTLGRTASSPSISKNLQSVTSKLTDQYKTGHTDSKVQALAVFPLNSNPELAKRRVGFALSELLTHQFVQSRSFTVVERSETLKILEEQKLQQTGAIDPEKAVQVGKLIGAEILVLGSVEKIGDKYLVNARMVQVENGAVLATAYEEFPAQTFEESAKPYLSLVPTTQSIGIYGVFNQHLESKSLPAFPNPSGGTVQPQPFELILVGAGLRYQPTSNWQLDFSFMIPKEGTTVGNSSSPWGTTVVNVENGLVLRALLGFTGSLHEKLRYRLAGGLVNYRLSFQQGATSDKQLLPLAQAGLEFRPQPRIGLGLFVNYEIPGVKLDITQGEASNTMIELSPISWEPTISFYF